MIKQFRTSALLLLAMLQASGCSVTIQDEVIRPLGPEEQAVFAGAMQDPRRHWITVYASDSKPVYANTHRLHPQQVALLPFVSDPLSKSPVILLRGRRRENIPALIDTSSAVSWSTFRGAAHLSLIPLGPPQDTRYPNHVADDIPGFASLASKIVFESLHVESAIFFTRLAHGPLGPLNRGETESAPLCVIGTDLLRSFRFVQFNYPAGHIMLSSTTEYEPSRRHLAAELPLVGRSGAIAVQGHLDKVPLTLVLDSAGDFEIAMMNPDKETIREVLLGDAILHNATVTDARSAGIEHMNYPRIGKRLLSNFKITLDFKRRIAYFERPQ